MRWVFSVVSLLLVVFVVMKLTTTQLKTALPAADAGAPAPDSLSAPVAPATAARAVADQMQQAMAQGAAARASAADE